MAWKVDERIPKDLFVKLMIKKSQHYQRPSQKQYRAINYSCQYWTHYGRFQIL